MTNAERLVALGVATKTMVIPHPRLTKAHERLTELRALGRATKGLPQEILPIIGPTGSGKSTSFKSWMGEDAPGLRRRGDNRPPPTTLHVTLSAKSSVKQLGIDILQSLGQFGLPAPILNDMLGRQRGRRTRLVDPFQDIKHGQLMYAAAVALDNAGIELLGIDELHHLIDVDNDEDEGAVAWSVSEALKVLADTGVCPIAVLGIHSAERIISADNNPQFAGRCTEPMSFNALDITVPEDRNLFIGYVAALSRMLVTHKVFDVDQNLLREDFGACFFDLSRGVIGTVSRLVDKAAAIAIREGKDRIERQHLSTAARSWAIPMKLTDYDPWNHGARDLKLLKREH